MKIKTFIIAAAAVVILMAVPSLAISMNKHPVQPPQEIRAEDVYAMMSQDSYAQAMKFDIVPLSHWKDGVEEFTGYVYVPSEETCKLAEERWNLERPGTEYPLWQIVSWAQSNVVQQGVKLPETVYISKYYDIYRNGKFFFEE